MRRRLASCWVDLRRAFGVEHLLEGGIPFDAFDLGEDVVATAHEADVIACLQGAQIGIVDPNTYAFLGLRGLHLKGKQSPDGAEFSKEEVAYSIARLTDGIVDHAGDVSSRSATVKSQPK
jgi:hypothetical protein